MAKKFVCSRHGCLMAKKAQDAENFLVSRDPIVDHHPYCRSCLNEMIDLKDLETVFKVLKTLQTPFICELWEETVLKYDNDYLYRYIKRLNGFKRYESYRYEDSIFISDKIIEDEEKKNELKEQFKDMKIWNDDWMGEYTNAEIKYLEKYLAGLEGDFKIETTTQRDYAKTIALASLDKVNAMAAKRRGEPEAAKDYASVVATFDKLNKTAKFAESERSRTDVALGNFGKIFNAVEEHNWVPEYIPEDKDMFDMMIEQFSNIDKSVK